MFVFWHKIYFKTFRPHLKPSSVKNKNLFKILTFFSPTHTELAYYINFAHSTFNIVLLDFLCQFRIFFYRHMRRNFRLLVVMLNFWLTSEVIDAILSLSFVEVLIDIIDVFLSRTRDDFRGQNYCRIHDRESLLCTTSREKIIEEFMIEKVCSAGHS